MRIDIHFSKTVFVKENFLYAQNEFKRRPKFDVFLINCDMG